MPVDMSGYQMPCRASHLSFSHTPNIGFIVSIVSKFMHGPNQEHMKVVYKVLKYLKMTLGNGLFFKNTDEKCWGLFWCRASDIIDKWSTSGYCSWGNLVTWRSKNHYVVARSTAEAEFRA